MSLAKCARVQFEKCDDGRCGGYALDQRVLLCGGGAGVVWFATKFEFGAVQEDVDRVVETAIQYVNLLLMNNTRGRLT
jgi:hypothetical protein